MIAMSGSVYEDSTEDGSAQQNLRSNQEAMAPDEILSLDALMLSRAYLYTLFHKALGGEPCVHLIETLFDQQTIAVIDEYAETSRAMSDLKEFFMGLEREANEEFVDMTCSEFNRVFVGPARLPALPWESPYVSHESVLFNESTLEVRKAYDAHGWRVKHYLHIPDDHVAILCDFMARLAYQSVNEFEAGNLSVVRNQIIEQKRFVDEHLNHWLSQYAEGLLVSEVAPFYSHLAKGLAAFTDLDSTFLGEVLVWIDERNCLPEHEGNNKEAYAAVIASAACFEETKRALGRLKEMRLAHLDDNELNSASRQ